MADEKRIVGYYTLASSSILLADLPVGPGWRMYYVQHGDVLIVMLGGGEKSTQQSDIEAAIALSRTLEE